MRDSTFRAGTGIKASDLVLGCGSFGNRWGKGVEPAKVRRIFESYVEAGGSFIDSADDYQQESAEELIGAFTAGRRDDIVVATSYKRTSNRDIDRLVAADHRRVTMQSIEASLRRLNTDRIDLLWVDIYDELHLFDELIGSLDEAVRLGKVRHVGLTNFRICNSASAFLVNLRGWAPLVALQVEYSLVEHPSYRELLPLAQNLGLGTVGWSPLDGGLIAAKYRRGQESRVTNHDRLIYSEADLINAAAVDTVQAIAKEAGVAPVLIALTWMRTRGVTPILGPRSVGELHESLAAGDFDLLPDQVTRLAKVTNVHASSLPDSFLRTPAQRGAIYRR